MNIFLNVPNEIQHKIILYFQHPIAENIKKDKWFIKNFYRKLPKLISIKKRINYINLINNERYNVKPCGCSIEEEHLMNCLGFSFQNLPEYDPILKTTYFMREFQKKILHLDIIQFNKNKLQSRF